VPFLAVIIVRIRCTVIPCRTRHPIRGAARRLGMTRKTDPAGFEVGTIAPRELTPIERAAFGIFDTTPAGVQRNNRSEWRPVTEREEPEARPLDFVLTRLERDVAALAALHLEGRRRQQNARDGVAA